MNTSLMAFTFYNEPETNEVAQNYPINYNHNGHIGLISFLLFHCNSGGRASAHGAVGLWINPSWWTH